jgi:hypothetical protein
MCTPGAALSLQSHHHRSEHWIVVEGTARVTIDDQVKLITENQSIYIPLGAVHRMENPGKVPMVLIEVQTGSYLGEDDIVRYEDVYARGPCFKAYDVRGRLGIDLDPGIAACIGTGFARALQARRVVLGRDARASSADLAQAVAGALVAEGVEVLDLGLSGTEEMYHATTHFAADGGICVTASHNPMDWNGMKMVGGVGPAGPGHHHGPHQGAGRGRMHFGPARRAVPCAIAAQARAAYVDHRAVLCRCRRLAPAEDRGERRQRRGGADL